MLKRSAVVSLVLLVSACSSTEHAQEKQTEGAINLAPLACFFPDSPQQKAPAWVCDEAVPGLAVQAMGISDNALAGIGHQRQLALLDAQTVLAQQLKNRTSLAIENFTATKGQAGKAMVAKKSEMTQSLKVDKEIVGMKVFQSVLSQGKVYYTLVGLDKKSLKDNVKKVVQASVVDDSSLWQPLIANQEKNLKPGQQKQPSQELLAAAISEYVK